MNIFTYKNRKIKFIAKQKIFLYLFITQFISYLYFE